jgi:hypothetical protein
MKKIALLIMLSLTFIVNRSLSQSWVNEEIDDSGCSAYFPSIPEWELSYAEDSSLVWLGEVSEGDIFYGVICIEFSEPFEYDASKDELISVAENYLDYLRGEFKIVSHTGYVTGYKMESNGVATGISDNWTDDEGDPWAIKTWIDPFNMAVLYIYSSPDIPFTDNEDFYFNSFRFPDWDWDEE